MTDGDMKTDGDITNGDMKTDAGIEDGGQAKRPVVKTTVIDGRYVPGPFSPEPGGAIRWP
jgi:hypothetical protein